MTKKEVEQQWKSIEKNFGWSKVHRVMKFLNWEWSSSKGVPSIMDLKHCVYGLCLEVAKGKGPWIATGGFRVEKYRSELGGERLRVDFSAEWWDTE